MHLGANAGIFMASLDKVGDAYDDGSAQVLCLGCQRLFNDLNAEERKRLAQAIATASSEPRPRQPVDQLPDEFVRSVEAKVAQMNRHATAHDRPSRGAPVQMSATAACRRLKRCGLRCAYVRSIDTHRHTGTRTRTLCLCRATHRLTPLL